MRLKRLEDENNKLKELVAAESAKKRCGQAYRLRATLQPRWIPAQKRQSAKIRQMMIC